jgi:hypothetical protein
MALYTLFTAKHIFNVCTFLTFGLSVIGLTFPIIMNANGVTCITFLGLKVTCGNANPTVNLYDVATLCDAQKEEIVIAMACQLMAVFMSFACCVGVIFSIKWKLRWLNIPIALTSFGVSTALLLDWVLVASSTEMALCPPSESLSVIGWYLGSSFGMNAAAILLNEIGALVLYVALIATKNGSMEPDPVFSESEPEGDEKSSPDSSEEEK